MPFAIKQNKTIKFNGVWKPYDTRHFIRLPPHLGEALSSLIQSKEIKREEEEIIKEGERMQKAHNLPKEVKNLTLEACQVGTVVLI